MGGVPSFASRFAPVNLVGPMCESTGQLSHSTSHSRIWTREITMQTGGCVRRSSLINIQIFVAFKNTASIWTPMLLLLLYFVCFYDDVKTLEAD